MSALDAQLEKERQLTAAIDKAALGLREEFEDRIQKLREEMGDLVRSVVAQAPASLTAPADTGVSGNSSLLLSAAEAIDRTRSQTQVLAALLEGADGLASRAAVLLTRPQNIQGWGAVGFTEKGAAIEELTLAYRTGTPWGEMAGARGMVPLSTEQAAVLCKALGAERPNEAVLIPIALADRTAAVLYADRAGADEPFDVAGLQLLATFAGLTLETLPLRRRSSTPSLRHAAEATHEPGLVPWDPQGMTEGVKAEASAVEVETAERPAAAPVASAPPPVEAAAATDEVSRAAVEKAEAQADAETDADAPAKPRRRRSRNRGGAVQRSVAAGEVAPPQDLAGPGSAFAASPAGDSASKRQEDARRMARLLVSEIKLYNEAKVQEALKQGNILVALADEIEQSRKVYNERIDAATREQADYFRDELVRILAGGDRAALGS